MGHENRKNTKLRTREIIKTTLLIYAQVIREGSGQWTCAGGSDTVAPQSHTETLITLEEVDARTRGGVGGRGDGTHPEDCGGGGGCVFLSLEVCSRLVSIGRGA